MSDIAVISLFAGVGGFDLAARNLGIPTIAAVEIDDHARGVLAHQFPETRLYTDVTEVSGKELLGDYRGTVIVTGGFPCQDLSVAGKRAGLDGQRSGLFWEIIRIAEEIQPEILLLENVPGLLSSNGGRDMGTVIGALGKLGYRVGWRVLDAQHFGVPQRRRRVFIIASHFGADTLAEILFECESSAGDSASSNEPGEDFAGAVTESARNGGDRVRERERESSASQDSERTQPESKHSTPPWSNDQKTPWSSVTDTTGCLSPGAHPGGFNGQDAYTGQLVVREGTQSANNR